jgi:iron complex transport system ATP-binding protein
MTLRLDNILVTRGARTLLDGVSVPVPVGALTVLMGENGAGKSTLLKVASGDIRPDQGEVSLAGRSLNAWSAIERAQMRAVLPQESNIRFMFSAREVVLMGRSPHCHGYPGAHDRAIVDKALARMDVCHLANRLYPTLSGGERARVSLARVLAQLWESHGGLPRYLLLDEPIAALDIAHQHLVLNVARQYAHQEGVAVLAVLHDLNLAAQYADTIALLKLGKLLALGSPDEVLGEAMLETCFNIKMRRMAHPTTGRPFLFAA